MTTTAKIAAKGCKGTGITEEIAHRLQLGEKILIVAELVVETHHEKRNGDDSVDLSILTLEPAPNGMTVDHLRELQRSFYYERQLKDQGPTLTEGDDIEPKVADVLALGAQFRPHPYLASTLSTDDDAICDVCGQHAGAAQHADRAGVPDPFTVVANDDEDDDPDADDEDDLDEPLEPDDEDQADTDPAA